ncbi:MAG: hypothetical protein Q8P25_01230 [Candidatus Curtissbacteria bacterium]|nr:hypothetical protein [Candidatus Curtissbacteria bacterium]
MKRRIILLVLLIALAVLVFGVNNHFQLTATEQKVAPESILPQDFGHYFTPVKSIDQLIKLSEQQKKPFFPLEFENTESIEFHKLSRQKEFVDANFDEKGKLQVSEGIREEVQGYLITSENPIYFLSLENGKVISITDYVLTELRGQELKPSMVFPDELDLRLSVPEDIDYRSIHRIDNSDSNSRLLSVMITTDKKASIRFLKNLGETVSKGDRALAFQGSEPFHLLNLAFWPKGIDYPANSLLLQVNIHTPPAGSPYPYGYYEENFYSELNSFAMLNGKVAYLTR